MIGATTCSLFVPAVAFVFNLEGEEAESNSMTFVLGQNQPLAILFVVIVVVTVLGVREQLSCLVGRYQRAATHYQSHTMHG